MIKTGMLSVTFRKLSCEEIIALTVKAGLDGIEWGGDIHVPHGDVKLASKVGKMTKDAGLTIAAYGSYYRVGTKNEKSGPFEQTLETAVSLGAPTIRVWAGNQSSEEADEQWWDTIVMDSQRIASMAAKENVTVSYEYHGGTLTDTHQSALKLLREVDYSNIFTLWQPPVHESFEERLAGLQLISPWLSNVHVFHWLIQERRPLLEGKEDWFTYLKHVSQQLNEHYAMLEFVRDEDTYQFLQDAKTLKEILNFL